MISPGYCQLLARYGRWMNERLYAAAATLTDAERDADRGAFFGSIQRTLCHVVWADRAWLGRFTGTPYAEPAYGADLYDDFATLAAERARTDTDILNWAGNVDDAWLAGTLEYRALGDGRLRRLPAWVAAAHLFNHATHHRGQVTTMLKQAGRDAGVTDLPWLPGAVQALD